MEAVATLSLVCNILQVVDSSVKAVEICSQFYKYGATIDIENLSYICDQLSQTSAALGKAQTVSQLSRSDTGLVEVGKKVHDAAESLGKELNHLKSAPGAGRRVAVKKTLTLKWRATRIDGLKGRLEGLVQVLNTKILVHLSERLSVTIRDNGEILKKLDDRQEKIARRIAEGTTTVEQLVSSMGGQTRAHVTEEHIVTRTRIHAVDEKLDKLVGIQHHKAGFDKFMESLHFPEINLRQDTIKDVHEKTFEWIFERRDDTQQRWHDFPKWLQNDQPLHWVLGKPGSGKSTFMNFLVQDGRTLGALESSGQSTIVLSFFFWEAGVELQKSRVGLLRSLIYQLLKAIDQQKALRVWYDIVQPHVPALPTIWTSKQLLRLLQLIVQAVDQRFCFFLDGLDEFRDDVDGTTAIRAIQDVLKDQNRTKLCISSRPQTSLDALYQGCPKIIMQDLTETDIRSYIEDNLTGSPLTSHLGGTSSMQASQLVDEVVVRADGVFLWVTLVVKSLLRGIKNEDNWETLMERLDQLPSEIFDLYAHMWKRMADDYPIYAKEAALYLKIIQCFGQQNLFQMTIMADDHLRAHFSKSTATWGMEQFEMEVDHNKTEKRIAVCCAGFLEVSYKPPDHFLEKELEVRKTRLEQSALKQQPQVLQRLLQYYRLEMTTTVDFVHRTAAEFLRTPTGQGLLQARLCTEEELVERYLSSALILHFLSPPESPTVTVDQMWPYYLSQMKSDAASEFFSELEDVFKKLSHWRWWNLEDLDSGPFSLSSRNSRNDLDYIKTFIKFCPPQYVLKKLTEGGLAEDRDYLTELLEMWTTIDQHGYEDDLSFRNALLLLQRGADPNKTCHWDVVVNPPPLWSVVLFKLAWKYQPPRLTDVMTEVLTALLKAGVDPNASVMRCVDIFMWQEGRARTMSSPLILFRWSVWDIVTNAFSVPVDSISSLLRNAGAVSSGENLFYTFRRLSWCVYPTRTLKGRLNDFIGLFQAPSDFSYRANYFSLVNFLDSNEAEPCFFDNGLEVFHAAGWTDEEIRTTPGLEILWQELQHETDDSGAIS
ncbi:hypothetical protein Z517_00832 [Fonsecaea pedrosoi CBS 271.37]|uniref:NACHT domain-containing protein n=1 Tax=Fonsecaea pedrosoi CBS 271.37 TaxID=1442368 RepID=A0A0D2FFJ6_9EURO|nr:uncharacterized protein Z517_00832 [Fonsecaea pedrosoi CBS 271.37]KIW85442.1 hypothetical protein Z517_00832 [Fonsecaea pedrosoi CBS 271.37]